MILIAMGVSGAGKSLIGEMLAERLSCSADGDAFRGEQGEDAQRHSATDDDRWPCCTIRAAIEESSVPVRRPCSRARR